MGFVGGTWPNVRCTVRRHMESFFPIINALENQLSKVNKAVSETLPCAVSPYQPPTPREVGSARGICLVSEKIDV